MTKAELDARVNALSQEKADLLNDIESLQRQIEKRELEVTRELEERAAVLESEIAGLRATKSALEEKLRSFDAEPPATGTAELTPF